MVWVPQRVASKLHSVRKLCYLVHGQVLIGELFIHL